MLLEPLLRCTITYGFPQPRLETREQKCGLYGGAKHGPSVGPKGQG